MAKVSYRYLRVRETINNLRFVNVSKTAATALWFSSSEILNILDKFSQPDREKEADGKKRTGSQFNIKKMRALYKKLSLRKEEFTLWSEAYKYKLLVM
jgi:hypothetical protein